MYACANFVDTRVTFIIVGVVWCGVLWFGVEIVLAIMMDECGMDVYAVFENCD